LISKSILWFGRTATLACDGRCEKAWGINERPELYFMEEGPCAPRMLETNEEPRDPDDYVFMPDDSLGIAPEDPGTYEGGHAKPFAGRLNQENAHLMNKWCARECERSCIAEANEPIVLPDMSKPRPNMPHRRET
jgi:hypothetical protein